MRPLNMYEVDYLRTELDKARQTRAEASVGPQEMTSAEELESLHALLATKEQELADLRNENVELKHQMQELESTQRSE